MDVWIIPCPAFALIPAVSDCNPYLVELLWYLNNKSCGKHTDYCHQILVQLNTSTAAPCLLQLLRYGGMCLTCKAFIYLIMLLYMVLNGTTVCGIFWDFFDRCTYTTQRCTTSVYDMRTQVSCPSKKGVWWCGWCFGMRQYNLGSGSN